LLVFGRVGYRLAALLQRAEALSRQVPVRGAGQGEDHLKASMSRRAMAVGRTATHGAVLRRR
jgi:hypothetical protein